ncbi:hypothetical protein [Catellatospora vulcania]|uniref:hypothetical protein n=1 Tax=Catellatospora vulcania TaxID=1460450 RepID=UPI0012D4C337|nr:hypothetical protein [Catellatospora vulcania]
MSFQTPPGTSSPVGTAGGVAALVDLLGRAVTDRRLRGALGDDFAYVAGVCPELTCTDTNWN